MEILSLLCELINIYRIKFEIFKNFIFFFNFKYIYIVSIGEDRIDMCICWIIELYIYIYIYDCWMLFGEVIIIYNNIFIIKFRSI